MPGLKAKYDVWNRLVEVRNASNVLIATYAYNTQNQRVKKTVGTTVTTSFFSPGWRELESTTGGVKTTYIRGLRHIDDLVCRIKGNENLYAISDPNWNVVALKFMHSLSAGCSELAQSARRPDSSLMKNAGSR